MYRSFDPCTLRQSERNLFPGFNALVVGFLGEFRDRHMAMLIDHERLGTSAAQRRTRCKYQLQILIRLFITLYLFSDLKQTLSSIRAGTPSCTGA